MALEDCEGDASSIIGCCRRPCQSGGSESHHWKVCTPAAMGRRHTVISHLDLALWPDLYWVYLFLVQFYLDAIELVKPLQNLPVEEFLPRGDRYDGLRACIGKSLCGELHKLRVFMVGFVQLLMKYKCHHGHIQIHLKFMLPFPPFAGGLRRHRLWNAEKLCPARSGFGSELGPGGHFTSVWF